MNRWKAALVLAAATMTFAGGAAEAASTDTASTETAATEAAATEAASTEAASTESAAAETAETESRTRSLLTGRTIDAEIANNRPIAIMFNNIYDALPQAGIEEAKVVYEAPVEGGLTRLMGIFDDYRGLEKIGSVRSCRDYYIDFAKEFDAMYVHYGQAVYAFDKLNAEDTDNISGLQYQEQAGELNGYAGEDIFYRTDDRPAPHNVYTSEEQLNTAIERLGYDKEYEAGYTGHYKFAGDGDTITLNGGTANVIRPGYLVNEPWFEYDAENGFYNRFQYGETQIDQNTGNQLAYTNIIFQVCQWENYDDNGYLKIDTQSGGDMYYFTKGTYVKGTWAKENPDDPDSRAVYYDADGNEITLNQGRTWVCIIQDSYEENIVIE